MHHSTTINRFTARKWCYKNHANYASNYYKILQDV